MSISFVKTNDNGFAIYLHERMYNVAPDNPELENITTALKEEDVETLEFLLNKPQKLKEYMKDPQGNVEIISGEVLYKGTAIHNSVTDKILQFMHEGLPYLPVVRFLENLMQNPSARAIDELYDFLSHKGFPITPDGHFLAYKGVNHNFTDCYTRKIDNSPGSVVEFERNQVDDDRSRTCSFGLHVGTYEYASGYGPVVVLVKVNPADCVSVPLDHNAQKCRVAKYQVLKVYEDENYISDPYFEEEEAVYQSDWEDDEECYHDFW